MCSSSYDIIYITHSTLILSVQSIKLLFDIFHQTANQTRRCEEKKFIIVKRVEGIKNTRPMY